VTANPYPGLRPFEQTESHLFFGRDNAIDSMLKRLSEKRLLAVTGPSGCGKSSLVRAGLFDALKVGFPGKAGNRWRIIICTPGRDCMRSLSRELLLGLEHPAEPRDIDRLEAFLSRGPGSLADLLDNIDFQNDENLLLFVDQFEEIFRFQETNPDIKTKVLERERAESFVELMLAAVKQQEWSVYVVLTMRLDFLGGCAQFAGLAEAINDGHFLTPRLTREECEQAIREPARVFGGKIDGLLLNQLLNDMSTDPIWGERDVWTNPDQLPLMQHVLARMWDRSQGEGGDKPPVLRLDLYSLLGGFSGALSGHLDSLLASLPDDRSRGIAEHLFRALTRPSVGQERRDVRNPITVREALAVLGSDGEGAGAASTGEVPGEQRSETRRILEEVINHFSGPGKNFLMLKPPSAITLDTVIDISHESLIRQWKRLQGWVRSEQDDGETYRSLENNAKLWNSGRGGFLGERNLESYSQWWATFRPTEGWAKRYGDGESFDLTSKFLEKSRDHWKIERARLESEQREKLQQEQRAKFRGAVALGAGVLLLVAALGAAFAVQQWFKAEELRLKAEGLSGQLAKQLAEEDRLRAELDDSRSRRVVDLAISLTMSGDPENGALLAIEALPSDFRKRIGAGRVRPEIQSAIRLALSELQPGRRIPAHSKRIRSVSYGPDGKIVTAGDDKIVRVWDETGNKTAEIKSDEDVHYASFHPDGKHVITSSERGVLELWTLSGDKVQNLEMSELVDIVKHSHEFPVTNRDFALSRESMDLGAGKSNVESVAVSPDGRIVASGTEEGDIILRDAGKRDVGRLIGHRARVNALSFGADGKTILSASNDATAAIWDVTAGVRRTLFEGHADWVWDVHFSPDEKTVLTASKDGSIGVWDAATGTPTGFRQFGPEEVTSANFDENGKFICVGFSSGQLRIVDIANLALRPLFRHVMKADINGINDIAWGNDKLAIASDRGTVDIFDGSGGGKVKALVGNQEIVWADSDRKNRRALVLAGKKALVVDVKTGARISELHGPADGFTNAYFALGGQRVVAVSRKGVHFFDVATGKAQHLVERPEFDLWYFLSHPFDHVAVLEERFENGQLWDMRSGERLPATIKLGWRPFMVFSADGRLGVSKVSQRDQKTVIVWDARTGKVIHQLKGHTADATRAFFSRSGTRLSTSSKDKTAFIWDLESGQLTAKLQGHEDAVYSAIFSLDEKYVVTASGDRTAKIWRADNGQLVRTLRHESSVTWSAFSPDGKILSIVGGEGKLWDWATGKLIYSLAGPGGARISGGFGWSEFSPDGQLVSAYSYGSPPLVYIWSTKTGELLTYFPVQEMHSTPHVFEPDGSYPSFTADVKQSLGEGKFEFKKAGSGEAVAFDIPDSLKVGGKVRLVAGTANGSGYAALGADGVVRVYSSEDSRVFKARPEFEVVKLSLSSDGKQLLVAGKKQNVLLINVDADGASKRFTHIKGVLDAQFYSDGRSFMTAHDDGRLNLWNTATGKLDKVLIDPKEQKAAISHFAHYVDSENNNEFIATTTAEKVTLWRSHTNVDEEFKGTEIGSHTKAIRSVKFSKDGRLIITAAEDRTAIIWDVQTQKPLRILRTGQDQPISADFTTDAKSALVATGRQILRFSFDEPLQSAFTMENLDALIRRTREVLPPDRQSLPVELRRRYYLDVSE
jgi:WD40 repeat protein